MPQVLERAEVSNDSPQVVIERLASGQISEQQADVLLSRWSNAERVPLFIRILERVLSSLFANGPSVYRR